MSTPGDRNLFIFIRHQNCHVLQTTDQKSFSMSFVFSSVQPVTELTYNYPIPECISCPPADRQTIDYRASRCDLEDRKMEFIFRHTCGELGIFSVPTTTGCSIIRSSQTNTPTKLISHLNISISFDLINNSTIIRRF